MPDSMPQAEYFNNHLKGKYAYWLHMRYIVSFDHMGHGRYVDYEEDINRLFQSNIPYLDINELSFIDVYVDIRETDRVNSVIELRLKNNYSPDQDITIEELKLFRTWLATELLSLDQSEKGEQKYHYFTEQETHVLKYYSNNMYDYTIKILSEFGSNNVIISNISFNNCGCSHSSDLSSLYNDSINICDPIHIYKKNIYEKMVQMFSDLNFWIQWPREFILTFKKYIDNIIKTNLPLQQSNLSNDFTDCGCLVNNDGQLNAISILRRLSTSLDYIQSNNSNGHKNYINDALRDWSSMLYENMQW